MRRSVAVSVQGFGVLYQEYAICHLQPPSMQFALVTPVTQGGNCWLAGSETEFFIFAEGTRLSTISPPPYKYL